MPDGLACRDTSIYLALPGLPFLGPEPRLIGIDVAHDAHGKAPQPGDHHGFVMVTTLDSPRLNSNGIRVCIRRANEPRHYFNRSIIRRRALSLPPKLEDMG